MNRESFSGIIYKGFEWGNYWGNTDKYLKKLDIEKITFRIEDNKNKPVVTKLVANGRRV